VVRVKGDDVRRLGILAKRAPSEVWVEGVWDEAVFKNSVAVVGSRRMTEYGRRVLERLKVRQPLAELRMNRKQLSQEYLDIVADELNVKKVAFAEAVTEDFWATKIESETSVWLDTRVTEERKEGSAREEACGATTPFFSSAYRRGNARCGVS
jgi:hypothetical protein